MGGGGGAGRGGEGRKGKVRRVISTLAFVMRLKIPTRSLNSLQALKAEAIIFLQHGGQASRQNIYLGVLSSACKQKTGTLLSCLKRPM